MRKFIVRSPYGWFWTKHAMSGYVTSTKFDEKSALRFNQRMLQDLLKDLPKPTSDSYEDYKITIREVYDE